MRVSASARRAAVCGETSVTSVDVEGDELPVVMKGAVDITETMLETAEEIG